MALLVRMQNGVAAPETSVAEPSTVKHTYYETRKSRSEIFTQEE